MDINELTIGQAREIAALVGQSAGGSSDAGSEFVIGTAYLIRTVTHYSVGRVVRRTSTGLVLDEASWVADTGRYGEALAQGAEIFDDVEFRGDGAIVGLGAIVDADVWRHALPSASK